MKNSSIEITVVNKTMNTCDTSHISSSQSSSSSQSCKSSDGNKRKAVVSEDENEDINK